VRGSWVVVASCAACSGQWVPMSDEGAPSARGGANTAWTGDEVLVWGGWMAEIEVGCAVGVSSLHDGARYDPATDTWRPMAEYPSDEITEFAETVWAGDRWFVVFPPGGWGSEDTSAPQMAVYDPASDTWETLDPPDELLDPAGDYNPIWTGTEVFLYAGGDNAAAYDPATGTWRAVTPYGGSSQGYLVTAWTGEEAVVWSTGNGAGRWGGAWNPATNTWRALADGGAQPDLGMSTAAWIDDELVVVGWNDGLQVWRYTPASDAWTHDRLALRGQHYLTSAAFDFVGAGFVVWGGLGRRQQALGTGSWYDLEQRVWTPLDGVGSPSPRAEPATVFTGEEWVVWGGGTGACIEGEAHADGARWLPP